MFGSFFNKETRRFEKLVLWPGQEELCDFSEQHQICLYPKPRQSGYSEFHAEKAIFECFKHENTEIVVISKSEFFADYFLEYRVERKLANLPKIPGLAWPEAHKPKKDEVRFENGSTIKSITSSQSSAASMSLDGLIIDEAGGIDENYKNFKQLFINALPTLEANPNSWCAIIGTSVPGSYYNEMVREAYTDPDSEFKYFFKPWSINPKRDEEWYERQRKRLKDGVYTQFPRDMEDFFYVKDGLVFKNFDSRTDGIHIQKFVPNFNHDFIIGYDHGTKDPAVCLFALHEPYEDILYVYEEVYFAQDHGQPVSIIAKNIKDRLKKQPKSPTRRVADTQIFSKTGLQISYADIFKKYGISFSKAYKHDKMGSYALLSDRFQFAKIMISPSCTHLIEELRTHRWAPNRQKEEPEDKNNHCIDALRYICAEIKKKNKQGPVIKPKPYSKESEIARNMFLKSIGMGYASPMDKHIGEVNEWLSL